MPGLDRILSALFVTVAMYLLALWLRRRVGLTMLHPSLIAAPLLFASLPLLRFSVSEYQADSRLLTFLLGPATVAMAVPVYKHRALILRHWPALLVGVAAGSLVGTTSAVAMAGVLGLGGHLLLSVAPKSVTGPVAYRLSERLGGIPALTVALVQTTGILGATFGPALLNTLRIRNRMARGLALGVAAHAAGTERALQQSELEGAISAVATALNAVVATALVSPVVRLLLLVGERLGVSGP